MPLIELRKIYKDYVLNGGFVHKVLKNISLKIEPGEFVSVMGPSGSGKSTLMNILGSLDRPSSGEYYLNKRNISKLSDEQLTLIRKKQIGFVFQGFNLLGKRTVADNVSMPLIYCDVCKKDRRRQAEEILKTVNLKGYEDHYPNQLSGGMQQRVAIARALINNPDIILADEPTGNLDTKTGTEIMKVFQKLNKEKNITVIMITHEAGIAKYGRKLISIRDGEKEFDGPLSLGKKRGLL